MKRVCFVSAILCSVISILIYNNYQTSSLIAVGLVLLLGVFIAFKINYKYCFCVMFSVLFTFSAISSVNKIENIERLNKCVITIDAVVVENSTVHDNSNSTVIKVTESEDIKRGSKIQLWSYNEDKFKCGEKLELKIRINSLKHSDFKSYNYSNNIFASATLKKVIKEYKNDYFYTLLQKIRDYITNQNLNNLSYESSATLLGITIGEDKYFSDEFQGKVKITGVSHIMVVSGMHLAIIMAAFYSILRKTFNNRILKAVVTVMCVVFIIGVCGFTVSAIRSGIMFIFSSFAVPVKRENDSLNSLGLAVLLIYFNSPFAILSLSFQLSVLATFGVITVAHFFTVRINAKIKNKALKYLVEVVVVTLSASVTTMPVTIYNFETLSLISPVTNVLISYAVNMALVFNVIAIIVISFSLISPFAIPLYFVCEVSCRYINFVVNNLAKLPSASVSVPSWVFVFAVLLNLAIIYIMYTCKRREYLLKLKKLNEKR